MGRGGKGKGEGKKAEAVWVPKEAGKGKGEGGGEGKGKKSVRMKVVVAGSVEDNLRGLRDTLDVIAPTVEGGAGWAESCSKRLCILEKRLMYLRPLGHEILRGLHTVMTEWEPEGDVTYLLRTMLDVLTPADLMLRSYYSAGCDEAKMKKQIIMGLRLLAYEGCRRTFEQARDAELRRCYAICVVILREQEALMLEGLDSEFFGVFGWAEDNEVYRMVQDIEDNGKESSMKKGPHFEEVMKAPYAQAFLSLLRIKKPLDFVRQRLMYRQVAKLSNEIRRRAGYEGRYGGYPEEIADIARDSDRQRAEEYRETDYFQHMRPTSEG